MRRRTFIAGLAGAAAWSAVAHGQQKRKVPAFGRPAVQHSRDLTQI